MEGFKSLQVKSKFNLNFFFKYKSTAFGVYFLGCFFLNIEDLLLCTLFSTFIVMKKGWFGILFSLMAVSLNIKIHYENYKPQNVFQ